MPSSPQGKCRTNRLGMLSGTVPIQRLIRAGLFGV